MLIYNGARVRAATAARRLKGGRQLLIASWLVRRRPRVPCGGCGPMHGSRSWVEVSTPSATQLCAPVGAPPSPPPPRYATTLRAARYGTTCMVSYTHDKTVTHDKTHVDPSRDWSVAPHAWSHTCTHYLMGALSHGF